MAQKKGRSRDHPYINIVGLSQCGSPTDELNRVIRSQQTLTDLHSLLVLGDEVVVALRQ